jgi:hypothetical protein
VSAAAQQRGLCTTVDITDGSAIARARFLVNFASFPRDFRAILSKLNKLAVAIW